MGAPPRVVAIVGPTGVGKSDVGVAVAEALGGEVVNADSMQLYRGMDIGTAKLGEAERRGIPHHLLDIWAVTERASVADYQRRARAAIDELRARGRTPVLVGGSGLYLRAVLDRFDFPGTDPELRAALETRLAAEGPEALHRELAGADPQAATRILPSNGRRIVRALEVIELTGAPFTATLPDESRPHYRATAQVGLDTDATALDERLAHRTDVMFERGLVDEVRRLEADGLRHGVTARRALGYAQVLRLLDGELTEPAARDETVTATRRFARRQRSWFRRDGRIRWVEAGQPLERLVGAVVAAVTRSA